jgi:hypothetical protein
VDSVTLFLVAPKREGVERRKRKLWKDLLFNYKRVEESLPDCRSQVEEESKFYLRDRDILVAFDSKRGREQSSY